jgi:hypothetical protein
VVDARRDIAVLNADGLVLVYIQFFMPDDRDRTAMLHILRTLQLSYDFVSQ